MVSYGCLSKAQANQTSSQLLVDSAGGSQQSLSKFDSHPYDGPINFRALFWVDRGPVIWTMQTTIAVICFVEAILMQYLTYKVNKFSWLLFTLTRDVASFFIFAPILGTNKLVFLWQARLLKGSYNEHGPHSMYTLWQHQYNRHIRHASQISLFRFLFLFLFLCFKCWK